MCENFIRESELGLGLGTTNVLWLEPLGGGEWLITC